MGRTGATLTVLVMGADISWAGLGVFKYFQTASILFGLTEKTLRPIFSRNHKTIRKIHSG
jgi:hypothetical protein